MKRKTIMLVEGVVMKGISSESASNENFAA